MSRVGLAMIVKNESETLPRLAKSLEGKIDHAVVADTGSTDDTIEVAEQVFDYCGRTVIQVPWEGFSKARNAALEIAEYHADWVLHMDADETLEGELGELPNTIQIDGICAEQYHGALRFWLPRLVVAHRGWRWYGRAHEYLDLGGAHRAHTTSFHVVHHADGGSRGDKFDRERGLLEQDWGDRKDPRTAFYLARTYDDARWYREAIQWYRQRLTMDGWEEEKFYAAYRLGCCLLEDGSGDEGCGVLWSAWGMRPHRLEPLVALASYYRSHRQWAPAWLVMRTADEQQLLGGPGPDDLFVDSDLDWRLAYETSIVAWYVGQLDVGQDRIQVLQGLDLPEPYRSSVNDNARFYDVTEGAQARTNGV